MHKPFGLTTTLESALLAKKFIQTAGSAGGMVQSFEWIHDTFAFGLYYEKGYYDCYLYPGQERKNGIRLIILLKYLNNDPGFLDRELKDANLYNTLSSNRYIELIVQYFDLIKHYFEHYSSEAHEMAIAYSRLPPL